MKPEEVAGPDAKEHDASQLLDDLAFAEAASADVHANSKGAKSTLRLPKSKKPKPEQLQLSHDQVK